MNLTRSVGWLLGLLLTGCAQSVQPYYTAAAKKPLPDLVGEWEVHKALDDVDAGQMKPWICVPLTNAIYAVTAFDTNAVAAQLVVVTFQTAGQWYCDVTAGEPAGAQNRYWNTSVTPVHTLWRLRLSNDWVRLDGLQPEWLEKSGVAPAADLPFVEPVGEKRRLYTATPEQWQTFLTQHGTNEAAFSNDPAYLFRKRAAKE